MFIEMAYTTRLADEVVKEAFTSEYYCSVCMRDQTEESKLAALNCDQKHDSNQPMEIKDDQGKVMSGKEKHVKHVKSSMKNQMKSSML